jgi:hypothetical protein
VLGVQIFALGLLGELIIFTHAPHIKEYTIRAIHQSGDRTTTLQTGSNHAAAEGRF